VLARSILYRCYLEIRKLLVRCNILMKVGSVLLVAVYLLFGLADLSFAQSGTTPAEAQTALSTQQSSEEDPDTMMYNENQQYLFDIIRNRRTVRKFKPTPVPDEHIVKILDAARYAPTAGNQQTWKFLVVRDRSKLDLLVDTALSWYLTAYADKQQLSEEQYESTKKAIHATLTNVLSAPVYVAVLVDANAKYPDFVEYDGTLAAGYLMIAARSLGYGTGFFTSFFPEDKMKQFFNIPQQYKLICFTPIGVPETWPDTPPKKDLKEFIVYESFDKQE
jgi:nitroreductase